MKTIYSLRADPEPIKHMQNASLSKGTAGLKITHGLIGSPEWWQAIESGALQVHKLRGKISRFWPGHHGDWPEFELEEVNGHRSVWACELPAGQARSAFAEGAAVEVDYVLQELKTKFEGSSQSKVTLAIRAGARD